MIECVFTIDYEIYGNGQGDLSSLVHKPAEQLLRLFMSRRKRMVIFVEAAELQAIEEAQTDPAIADVKQQLRRAYGEGFEIALHIHPQWCNGHYRDGRWALDYREYNLCLLPPSRMEQIVDRSITYLRQTVGDPAFSPCSFRAGNWLFQPTGPLARILAARGIRVDSSVFKGGRQRRHGLDYRRATGNGYWWRFSEEVDVPDARGNLIEIPTYTKFVAPWQMLTRKRIAMPVKAAYSQAQRSWRWDRVLDLARPRYPLKLDFCRMTLNELLRMVDAEVVCNAREPDVLRPMVAIGHTKDLVDLRTVERFLDGLQERGVATTTFEALYPKLTHANSAAV
jgi:hypothetical protein